jgi:hypothetical protein
MDGVIVAATGGALPIADRVAHVARRHRRDGEKDERDLGRSEEKTKRSNTPNDLW